MNNTIWLPIAYAAPISYYALLLTSDEIWLEKEEYFVKQSIRNRCVIAGANGLLNLSVPLEGRKNKSFTKDIKISYSENWQHRHWQGIVSSYNLSPFFEFYMDDLLPLYHKQFVFLVDFNEAVQNVILAWLRAKPKWSFTEKYEVKVDGNDFRNYDWLGDEKPQMESYTQVFSEKFAFASDLSIFDLIFTQGNESKKYLEKNTKYLPLER